MKSTPLVAVTILAFYASVAFAQPHSKDAAATLTPRGFIDGEEFGPKGPPKWNPRDKIEKDDTLNCYHFPAGYEGSPASIRRCYPKDLPCNIQWRREVRNWRDKCGWDERPKPGCVKMWRGQNCMEPNKNSCRRLWEPDIGSKEYCIGKVVKEDGKGNRVGPIPKNASKKCPSDSKDGKCIKIEPDFSKHNDGNKCFRIYSKCANTFMKVCQGDRLPCQRGCQNKNTCVRGPAFFSAKAAMGGIPVVDEDAGPMAAAAALAEAEAAGLLDDGDEDGEAEEVNVEEEVPQEDQEVEENTGSENGDVDTE